VNTIQKNEGKAMKISARNVFEGEVSALKEGPINAEVELTTAGGDRIVAIITDTSVRTLGIAVGKPAVAVVKASAITLLPPHSPYRFTARNQLAGTIASVVKGAINSQVVITLQGGASLSAVVTNDAIGDLDLKTGAGVTALFKAGQVLLGVPA
jgi:molybdate transport system regulatory protein